MVKKDILRSPIFLILLLYLISASNSCLARGVKSVEIEAIGLHEGNVNSMVKRECESFRPTRVQIKQFFSKAYPVEGYVLMHSRYSPCYTHGSIRFSDGHFAKWKLYSGGAARLTFNRGDEVTVFYRNNGWIDPFAGGYDFRGY